MKAKLDKPQRADKEAKLHADGIPAQGHPSQYARGSCATSVNREDGSGSAAEQAKKEADKPSDWITALQKRYSKGILISTKFPHRQKFVLDKGYMDMMFSEIRKGHEANRTYTREQFDKILPLVNKRDAERILQLEADLAISTAALTAWENKANELVGELEAAHHQIDVTNSESVKIERELEKELEAAERDAKDGWAAARFRDKILADREQELSAAKQKIKEKEARKEQMKKEAGR